MGSRPCHGLDCGKGLLVRRGVLADVAIRVVFWVVVFLGWQLCWIEALSPGPSLCIYDLDQSQGYPYPYDRHEWFKYLANELPRPAPPTIAKAVKWEQKPSKVQMLDRIYERKFLLGDDVLEAARGFMGNLGRLRIALQKLLNGEPITIVTLGGSIMAGGDIYHPRRDTDCFVGQIFNWIQKTFPNSKHKFHNGCLPATGSTYISICLGEHVLYDDVDVVLLEFDINDSSPEGPWANEPYMNNRWRRGMEVLFRRLLQYPNSPALLYFHMWMPGFDQNSYWNSTIEDETDILVKYYELQSLSFRNAVFKPYRTNMPGLHRLGHLLQLCASNILGPQVHGRYRDCLAARPAGPPAGGACAGAGVCKGKGAVAPSDATSQL
eukprot:jgi/Botrbrau1/761/Bobra.0181s0020.1